MKLKIWSLLLMLGMCLGVMDDAYGQSRRARMKAKWKKTFGTPRNPKPPPVPKGFPQPPAPPKAPVPPRKAPPPPVPAKPPTPPKPPAPPTPR